MGLTTPIYQQVAIERLPLLTLAGQSVNLGQYCDNYGLVIFLRHLA